MFFCLHSKLLSYLTIYYMLLTCAVQTINCCQQCILENMRYETKVQIFQIFWKLFHAPRYAVRKARETSILGNAFWSLSCMKALWSSVETVFHVPGQLNDQRSCILTNCQSWKVFSLFTKFMLRICANLVCSTKKDSFSIWNRTTFCTQKEFSISKRFMLCICVALNGKKQIVSPELWA